MIEQINITHYRKLKNIDFKFTPEINLISGTNGTCKTSLLQLIGNSFQKLNKNKVRLSDAKSIDIISSINNLVNPKIERLARGDHKYNDPANGTSGTLFKINYIDYDSLEFRRHNSRKAVKNKKDITLTSNTEQLDNLSNNRYAIKPQYTKKESLPELPVLYLGLSRLFPYGEFYNDSEITKLRTNFPDRYKAEISELYAKLSRISISNFNVQKMGSIKKRHEFSSNIDGIDSNTISSGEDNLLTIITALISLKYYHDNISGNKRKVESILLIDEFDATLHPGLQINLLNIMREFSLKYAIQIICTTHSLSALENAFENKYNVIYLYDNISNVVSIQEPNIYKIRMYLDEKRKEDILRDKKIPILTEDDEARFFLKIIFDYLNTKKPEFAQISHYFHFVKTKIGADNLKTMFEDEYFIRNISPSICIFDGDKTPELHKCIITLPGSNSPEFVFMDYAIKLLESNDDTFWLSSLVVENNIGKLHFISVIKPAIESIEAKITTLKTDHTPTKGVRRELSKKIFNEHKLFFELIAKHWVQNTINREALFRFYKNLNVIYKRVSDFHGISSQLWNIQSNAQ